MLITMHDHFLLYWLHFVLFIPRCEVVLQNLVLGAVEVDLEVSLDPFLSLIWLSELEFQEVMVL